ncbi:hypothetical protein VPH35_104363 [Triticum aestivum]|uniref:Uncharacterized protein n=1 Tax=Triticum urartu TaxID=4572 RepID=A0A8R7Q1X4_TRIUA
MQEDTTTMCLEVRLGSSQWPRMVMWVSNDGSSSSSSVSPSPSRSTLPAPGMEMDVRDGSFVPSPPSSSVSSGALGSPSLHVLSLSGLQAKPPGAGAAGPAAAAAAAPAPAAAACLVASTAHASTAAARISDTRAMTVLVML